MRIYSDNDAEYASSRLRNTLVLHSGRPVEVLSIKNRSSGVRCEVKDVIEGGVIEAPMSELDITPVQLGYVNFNNMASFVCRVPTRGQGCQQGLRYATMRSLNGMRSNDIPLSVLGKTIINDYPSLASCIKAVETKHSQAFHRNWMVDQEYNLIYKGTSLVGKVLEGRCVLDSEYSYLQETLDEDTGN